MNKRTKIVCTMGPACDDDDILREMIKSGMNVARFNFSHGSYEEHHERIERVRRISRELGIPVGILLDTKGPEIRTGFLKDHAKVTLAAGSMVTVTAAETSEDLQGTAEHFYLDHLELPREVHPGGTILIDDGLIGLTVKSIAITPEGNVTLTWDVTGATGVEDGATYDVTGYFTGASTQAIYAVYGKADLGDDTWHKLGDIEVAGALTPNLQLTPDKCAIETADGTKTATFFKVILSAKKSAKATLAD